MFNIIYHIYVNYFLDRHEKNDFLFLILSSSIFNSFFNLSNKSFFNCSMSNHYLFFSSFYSVIDLIFIQLVMANLSVIYIYTLIF
jgi:uncharacterized membrane protein YvbJ